MFVQKWVNIKISFEPSNRNHRATYAYQMARHSTAGKGTSTPQTQKCLISSTRCGGTLL